MNQLINHPILKCLLLCALACAPLARAAAPCDPAQQECVELGRWQFALGIGAGLRTNPLVDGEDIPLVLLPMVSYTGERFFVHNLDLGMFVWENEQHQINLLLTPGYDQVYFNRWDPLNFVVDGKGLATSGGGKEELPDSDGSGTSGSNEFVGDRVVWDELPERHMAGLAGLEYSWGGRWGEVQLHWLKDVTAIHHGEERRLALARHWQAGQHHLGLSLGWLWQDAALLNYYFGIAPGQSTQLAAYTPGAAISRQLRFDWNYRLNANWELRALCSYRQLPGAISNSPLVDKDYVVTAFVGGVYHF